METLACTTLFALHKVSATGRETCLFLMINTLTGTHKTCELCTHIHTCTHCDLSLLLPGNGSMCPVLAERCPVVPWPLQLTTTEGEGEAGRAGYRDHATTTKKSEAENTTLGQIRVLMMLTLHRDRNNLCLLDSVNVKTTNNLSK